MYPDGIWITIFYQPSGRWRFSADPACVERQPWVGRAITDVRCAVLENAWEYGHSTALAKHAPSPRAKSQHTWQERSNFIHPETSRVPATSGNWPRFAVNGGENLGATRGLVAKLAVTCSSPTTLADRRWRSESFIVSLKRTANA